MANLKHGILVQGLPSDEWSLQIWTLITVGDPQIFAFVAVDGDDELWVLFFKLQTH